MESRQRLRARHARRYSGRDRTDRLELAAAIVAVLALGGLVTGAAAVLVSRCQTPAFETTVLVLFDRSASQSAAERQQSVGLLESMVEEGPQSRIVIWGFASGVELLFDARCRAAKQLWPVIDQELMAVTEATPGTNLAPALAAARRWLASADGAVQQRIGLLALWDGESASEADATQAADELRQLADHPAIAGVWVAGVAAGTPFRHQVARLLEPFGTRAQISNCYDHGDHLKQFLAALAGPRS